MPPANTGAFITLVTLVLIISGHPRKRWVLNGSRSESGRVSASLLRQNADKKLQRISSKFLPPVWVFQFMHIHINDAVCKNKGKYTTVILRGRKVV